MELTQFVFKVDEKHSSLGRNVSVDDDFDNSLFTATLSNNEDITRSGTWFNNLRKTKLILPKQFSNIFKYIKFQSIRRQHNKEDFLIPYLERQNFTPLIVKFKDIDKEFAIPLPYSHYVVSKDGEVRELLTGNLIQIEYSIKFGYKYVILPLMGIRAAGVHRLVAFAWMPNDDYSNKFVIDHIDSDKLNNNVNNLRWVTVKTNASKESTFQCKSIIMRNVDTKEILEFRSISEANRDTGLTLGFGKAGSLVRFGKIWTTKKGRYEAYYKDDFKEWAYKDIIPLAEYKYRVTYNDGCVKYYYNLAGICRENNISINTPIRRLGNEIGGLIEDIIMPNLPSFTEIEVYDIVNKTMMTFPKVSYVVNKLGIPESNVRRALSNKTENTNVNGYLIRIKSDKPWDVSNIESQANTSSRVRIVNINDKDDITIYNSKKALGRDMRLTNHQINNYIDGKLILNRNNKLYRIESCD